ncbi:cold shock and DUF1294 domain-containing protein [Acidihalobacter prosperus]|uniref:CSD domain-containing protein n=1 Tax=Acidihalobacter prosperus TaxID=160660 RepID=A0A1A6C2A3_9GAMM|nr:cold shock and DUF1294 domain-containing protein [Acidihalobacter prosperus]OBS08680.1 hypothetical protein Thpro_022930 [Acidihalobacter prosperus]
MRHAGRITNWIDDKGFGFITPSQGGGQVFVHITAFDRLQGRPALRARVTYELKKDSRGRTRAENVQLADPEPRQFIAPRGRPASLALPLSFLAGLVGLYLAGRLPQEILWLYWIASLVTFLLYAKDKYAARKNRWRTPENTLHLFALVGGWPGAWIAQQRLRHKSSKHSFRAIFWITVAVNCGALAWILSPEGAPWLESMLTALHAQWPHHGGIQLAR